MGAIDAPFPLFPSSFPSSPQQNKQKQSAAALSAIRAWSAKTIDTMTQIAGNPDEYFAGKMRELQASLDLPENAALKQLGEQAKQGNKTAANLFQQTIANQQFDGREYVCARGCVRQALGHSSPLSFFPSPSPPRPTPKKHTHTVFDMGMLGLNGEEAEQNQVMKAHAFSNPLMTSFLADIPEGLGFVASPMTIEEQAKRLLGKA